MEEKGSKLKDRKAVGKIGGEFVEKQIRRKGKQFEKDWWNNFKKIISKKKVSSLGKIGGIIFRKLF